MAPTTAPTPYRLQQKEQHLKIHIDHETSERERFVYHVLEHLLKLWVRMISTGFDVVVGESIAKTFVKLLEDLAETNGVQLNEFEKL